MSRKKKKYKKVSSNEVTANANTIPTEVKKESFYILVAGSRTFKEYDVIERYLDLELSIAEITPDKYYITIVEGEADGVDLLAKEYAFKHNYAVRGFHAQWQLYGNQAGFIRNEQMHKYIAENPNRLCICFKHYLSNGKGTAHSIELGKKYGTNVVWYDISEGNSMNRVYYNNSNNVAPVEDSYYRFNEGE